MCWPAFRLLSPEQPCKYGYIILQCFRPEICQCGVAVECVQDWGEVCICMRNSPSGIGQALICIMGLFFIIGAITAYVSRYLWSLYKGHCTSVIVQLVFCAFVLSIQNKILSIRLWQMTTNLASGFHCTLPFESFQLTTFISRVCPNLTTDQIQEFPWCQLTSTTLHSKCSPRWYRHHHKTWLKPVR